MNDTIQQDANEGTMGPSPSTVGLEPAPQTFDCPQCGCEVLMIFEGVCADCGMDNQTRLNQHNAQYDRWQSLTDDQRDREIRRACGL